MLQPRLVPIYLDQEKVTRERQAPQIKHIMFSGPTLRHVTLLNNNQIIFFNNQKKKPLVVNNNQKLKPHVTLKYQQHSSIWHDPLRRKMIHQDKFLVVQFMIHQEKQMIHQENFLVDHMVHQEKNLRANPALHPPKKNKKRPWERSERNFLWVEHELIHQKFVMVDHCSFLVVHAKDLNAAGILV